MSRAKADDEHRTGEYDGYQAGEDDGYQGREDDEHRGGDMTEPPTARQTDGSHRRQRARGGPGSVPEARLSRLVRQQWPLLLLAACIAVAAIVVPPLVIPRGGYRPPGAAPAPASSAPTVVTSLASQPAPTTTPDTSTPPASGSATAPTGIRSPAGFEPVTVQAEDPGNLLTAPAEVVDCPTCDGGQRVRYIGMGPGQVVVRTTLSTAGLRTVTVVYESEGLRTFKVSINGATPLIRNAAGPDWTTPQRFSFSARLPAGLVLIAFYNDQAPAPDLDAVTIT
jgi:hypothetical protein